MSKPLWRLALVLTALLSIVVVPEPASARSVTADEDCGGAIEWYAVRTCTIAPGQEHSYTVTTTVDADRLRVRLSGQVSGRLVAVNEQQDCLLGNQPETCVVPTAGTYRLVVTGDGGGGYTLSLASIRTGACTPLSESDLSPAAPGRPRQLSAGVVGECFSMNQTAGEVIRIGLPRPEGVEAVVYDAAGDVVCNVSHYLPGHCTLSGSGPFRLLMATSHEEAIDYSLRVARISHPTGCAVLPAAPFGDPGEAVAHGTLPFLGAACRTVTTTPGRYMFRFHSTPGAPNLRVQAFDAEGGRICETEYPPVDDCVFTSGGTVLLLLDNDTWGDSTVDYHLAAVPLSQSTGCKPETGTGWNIPVGTDATVSPVQVDCHPFSGAPGERILVDAPEVARHWITAAGGDRICPRDEEQDGCVLPGSGPYRVLSYGTEPAGYTMAINRLSDPVGCATVTPGRFGSPPAGPAGNRCRILQVPSPGRYLVSLPGAGVQQHVYDSDGRRVCQLGVCDYPAAGSYTVITQESARIAFIDARSTDGCTSLSGSGVADLSYAGSFGSAGEYDCLRLPTSAGGTIAPTEPDGAGRTWFAVLDADGVQSCVRYNDPDFRCTLSGRAPFRMLLRAASDASTGDYGFAVLQASSSTGCSALPRGDFTNPGGSPVVLTASRFASCLAIPAGGHSANEVVQFVRTAGTGTARATVFDASGVPRCQLSSSTARHNFCHLAPNAAYQAVLIGSAASSTFRVTRKDVTAGARGCVAGGSTTVGGAPAAGTLANGWQLRCHRIAAASTDRLVVNTRDTGDRILGTVVNAAGSEACTTFGWYYCKPHGSTSYQVVVWSTAADGSGGTYHLDNWRISSAAGLPSECPTVPSAAYGFGPLTGQLSATRPAGCAKLPIGDFDRITGQALNTTAGSPPPGIVAFGTDGAQVCGSTDAGGGFNCHQGPKGTYLVLVGLPEKVSQLGYRVTATCEVPPLCGGAVFGVRSVTPARAESGKVHYLTLSGSSFHVRDVVQLTRSGQTPVKVTVRAVSADRKVMAVAVDLRGVAAGTWGLTVRSYAGSTASVPGGFVVTPPALKPTRAPSISGTARVGAVVRAVPGTWYPAATSYRYQWRVNGAAISGATASTYRVAAPLVGRRLSVTVAAVRTGWTTGVATSASVPVYRGLAPRVVTRPAVRGTVAVGRTVSAYPGTWSPSCTSYGYQWYSGGRAVAGGNRSTLRLTTSMRGRSLFVAVVCHRTGHYDGRALSPAVVVRR